LDSTSTARKILKERFERLVYKGNPVTVSDPAAAQDLVFTMNDLFPNVLLNDPGLSKASLFRDPDFQEFANDHLLCLQYSFQFKKCLKDNCR